MRLKQNIKQEERRMRYMYIEPFWCGVIAAFLAEAVVCAVLIARATKTNWNVEEDETNEE